MKTTLKNPAKTTPKKRPAPQTAFKRPATIYEARNQFRAQYSKHVEPKNFAELDTLADLWFEGDLHAFSFAEGSVVLHEVQV